MYSDTLIVVISLIIMIIVGLVFRTCCLKLTSCNQRKERVRGGLRQLADHMHHVTRSMANDLELPDSPKTVIRTYSNAARGPGSAPPAQLQQHQHNNSKETEAGLEMASLPTARSLDPRDIQIHHSDE